MNKADNVKFDLLENGLDFATSGLRHILSEDDKHALKYAILHLSAGIELILKDALRREHWSLIFENADKADEQLLASGDFISINLTSVLSRLDKICGIRFSQDETGILKSFKKLRNKTEHFELQENVGAIRSLSSKVLLILLTYLEENVVNSRLSEEAQDYISNLNVMRLQFEEYVHLKMSKLKSLLSKAKVECCPVCRNEALILDDPLCCAFCGYTDSPDNIANLYAENILNADAHICMTDGGEFPVLECPHCSADTYVSKERGYVCFTCLETDGDDDIRRCNDCEALYIRSEDGGIGLCDACIAYRIEKD